MPNQMCKKTAEKTIKLKFRSTLFIPIKSNYTQKSSTKKKAKFRQQQYSL